MIAEGGSDDDDKEEHEEKDDEEEMEWQVEEGGREEIDD